MTPLERMSELGNILRTIFEKLQWQGDAEAIELTNEIQTKLAELQEQEKLLAEIF